MHTIDTTHVAGSRHQVLDVSPTLADGASRARREILSFLALTYVTVLAVSLAFPGTIDHPGPAPLLGLMTPATVVLLLFVARRRSPALPSTAFGLRRLGLAGWPAAILLPVLAVAGPFVIADLLGVLQIHDVGGLLTLAAGNVPIMTILVLGEEIGWRGYMLARMRIITSPPRASVITGFAQALFHLPLIVLTQSYDNAGNRLFVAVGAVLVISCAGVLFGWLRVRTGSLWPVAIAHAVVNTCIIEAPYVTSRHPDVAAYVAGEAGVITLAATALITVVLYRCATWTPRATGARQPTA